MVTSKTVARWLSSLRISLWFPKPIMCVPQRKLWLLRAIKKLVMDPNTYSLNCDAPQIAENHERPFSFGSCTGLQTTRLHVQLCTVTVRLGRKQYQKKNRKWLCFPSFTPPPRPPCPFLTVIALCAFSSLTRIVLSVEVKVVLIYLCCISNKPQHSPESIIETQ